MSNHLALAAYAQHTGNHVLREPNTPEWRRFVHAFDHDAYLHGLAGQGFVWVDRDDDLYPGQLAAIHDSPVGLFVRGDHRNLARFGDKHAVAVVGARACSPYGAEAAKLLARELAEDDVIVVSGLARGIDAEAHRAAIEAGGMTVAVLGCGIDRTYPSSHAALALRIIETGGLILSEYAPTVEPAPWRFPARNRIVAGLCRATVVVEARERSGTLITADLALEEGRDLFAVPGEVTSTLSVGTNDLLRRGVASVCVNATDITSTWTGVTA